MDKELINLIKAEGWELDESTRIPKVIAFGQSFPIAAPFAIYGKLYREETNPDTKYTYLKRMHDLMWPHDIITWNFWDERRFREHCENWNYITYAGGASTGKSYTAAKLAILTWLSDPKGCTVIVASTTLESLNSRIFGYCIRLLSEAQVPVAYTYRQGMPPKILYDLKDKIHGIYALAAKRGDDDKAIRDIIGRHPKRRMLVVLDEATDMPLALLKALPNLESGAIQFQIMAIGNSLSKFDLHGSLSTPLIGWKAINPLTMNKWETTQKNGVCLFFSCYESPAIHEKDPKRKEVLSQFLITKEQIEEKEKQYGKNSDSFYRFVLGFWKDDSADDVVISSTFMQEFDVAKNAEWSGLTPLSIVAGLDPAFSTGGDQCILRLGILGVDIQGKMLLDFRKEELLFKLRIFPTAQKSAELQIADQVIEILNRYKCSLGSMAVDATGQGRALSEVIRLRAQAIELPIKIYSTRIGNTKDKSFDVVVLSSLELWNRVRDFIQTNQLRGIDGISIRQLTSRLVERTKGGKLVLESKVDYKSRMGSISPSLAHSPDEADSLSLCLQAAIIKHGFFLGQRREVPKTGEDFFSQKLQAFFKEKQIEEKHETKGGLKATFEGSLDSGEIMEPWLRRG